MNQRRRHRPPQPARRRGGRLRNSGFILLLCAVALSAARCAPAKPTPAAKPKSGLSSATDPCAQRLHDLLGGLLLYYAQHDALPPNLKSLALPSGDVAEAMHCPVSNQPYIYDPQGLPAPDGSSLLVIYDAVPAHGGYRWAVEVNEPRPGKPLTGEVIAVPETRFARSPGAR